MTLRDLLETLSDDLDTLVQLVRKDDEWNEFDTLVCRSELLKPVLDNPVHMWQPVTEHVIRVDLAWEYMDGSRIRTTETNTKLTTEEGLTFRNAETGRTEITC
jgi:hypothetical protein